MLADVGCGGAGDQYARMLMSFSISSGRPLLHPGFHTGFARLLALGSALGFLTLGAPGRGLLFVCLSLSLFVQAGQVLAYFHQVTVFKVNPIWTDFFDICKMRTPEPG